VCRILDDSRWEDGTRTSNPTKEGEVQVAQPTATPATTLTPRAINVDKNSAYPKAIAELKAAGVLPAHVELR
jgi:IS6 family transposase